MGAILPANTLHLDKAQKGLVDKCGRLECVIALLAREIILGAPVQLIIHQRYQAIEGRPVPLSPSSQQRCNGGAFLKGWVHHKSLRLIPASQGSMSQIPPVVSGTLKTKPERMMPLLKGVETKSQRGL